jgi:pimeloyl-ACP methyl ester carboxylesterase
MPLEGYIGTCAALRDADLRDDVQQIKVPAQALCGAEDMATTPEQVRGLADSLPDAQLQLIDGAGHTPSVEQPTAVADAIMQFLKERQYV